MRDASRMSGPVSTAGASSTTPLSGFAVTVHGRSSVVPLQREFEYGAIAFAGSATLGGATIAPGELVYLGCGREELQISSQEHSELLIIGGTPFHEELLMWWNFVGRSQEEIMQAHDDWQRVSERFGEVPSRLARIDAPRPQWMKPA